MRWLRTLLVAVLAGGFLTACAGVADFRASGDFELCAPGPCPPLT